MSLYVLSDTHLSLTNDKPMDIFGNRWNNYVDKLYKEWNNTITKNDTVVIPGDISWAMSLNAAISDLKFIDDLNGQKIIGKGNHDYWWTTFKKMGEFLSDNNLNTIKLLYNNAYEIENFIVCGSRGWYIDENSNNMPQEADYKKIILRESARLELSLIKGAKLNSLEYKNTVVFLHFPPYFKGYVCREIVDILHKYNVENCFFGHIHGVYDIPLIQKFENINFAITSSDYLNFIPLCVDSLIN